MRFVELTPEGKIVRSLMDGPKSYSELRSATGLSDRWLSLKLREMASAGIVGRIDRKYFLRNLSPIEDPLFSAYLREESSLITKARLIAEGIGEDDRVLAVILFGSLARGTASEGSDIDLLIVTRGEIERPYDRVYDLMFKYDVPVDAVFITLKDLMMNMAEETSFMLEILSGYEVLLDRGNIRCLLSVGKVFLSEWSYDEEAGAWIRRKSMLT